VSKIRLPLSSEIRETNFDIRIGPPNKIQARVLPFMLKGSDIIAQAPPTQERIIS
jgi:superfamily II DNA/RNA helicase